MTLLLSARGSDFTAICTAADALRQRVNGEEVSMGSTWGRSRCHEEGLRLREGDRTSRVGSGMLHWVCSESEPLSM